MMKRAAYQPAKGFFSIMEWMDGLVDVRTGKYLRGPTRMRALVGPFPTLEAALEV